MSSFPAWSIMIWYAVNDSSTVTKYQVVSNRKQEAFALGKVMAGVCLIAWNSWREGVSRALYNRRKTERGMRKKRKTGRKGSHD